MFEKMDKLMLAGLGALSMSKEKAEKIFDEYVEKGKAEHADKSGFVKEMMNSAEKTRGEFEKMISKQIHETVDKLNLATKEDVKKVEKKVDKLSKKE
jgi:polyhydroxyalkanoate synthesis regulator phasin